MDLYTINYIKTHEYIYRFLRDDSSWYKLLNRSSSYLPEVERLAKEKYSISIEDRIKKFSDHIELVNTFLDVLK